MHIYIVLITGINGNDGWPSDSVGLKDGGGGLRLKMEAW